MWFDVIPFEVRDRERYERDAGKTRFITKGVLRGAAQFLRRDAALCMPLAPEIQHHLSVTSLSLSLSVRFICSAAQHPASAADSSLPGQTARANAAEATP